MPRPAGSRNRDYASSERALALALRPHLLDDDGRPNTVKALATAAGVSVPTIRHYFGDYEGIIGTVLRHARDDADPYLTRMATYAGGTAESVLERLLNEVTAAWRHHGLGRLFASGMALGVENDQLGPRVVDDLLEPFLQAVERLLASLIKAGRIIPVDTRATALTLMSPVVVALLHQENLRGDRCRLLDMDTFVTTHVRCVLHGITPSTSDAGTPEASV